MTTARILSAPRPAQAESWLRQNLHVLQQHKPEAARGLMGVRPTRSAHIVATPGGEPSLALGPRGKAVYVHSSYDPRQEARIWADQAEEQAWQVAIVLGFGMGYHVEELLRRYPDRQVIVLIPDPDVFAAALDARDLRGLLSHPFLRLMVVPTRDAGMAATALFEHLQQRLDQFKLAFFPWPFHRRVWSDFWDQVQRHIGELSRQQLVNLGTYSHFSLEWQKNCFTNLPVSAYDPGAPALYPLFRNRPAILVASGPSLEKNVHLLAAAKDRALIVAIGSAIEALRRHGIEPDLLVSFDAGADNFFPFAKLDTRGLPLVYSAILYPLVLTEYQGPRFVMGVDVYPYERWLYRQLGLDRGYIHSGPSTANPAWDLVRQMGCDPIVFVGQDLALTNNRSHAEGVSAAHAIDVKPGEVPPGFDVVEDVFGNPVLTTKVMLSMKVWFEQRIALDDSGRTYIDATEGGAYIKGTQVMSLQTVIDRYCQEPFHPYERILEVHQEERARLQSLDLNRSLPDLLKRVQEELKEIRRLCHEARGPLAQLMEANAAQTFSPELHDAVVAALADLDQRIGSIDTYREFVRPAITHNVVAFDLLSSQIQHEPNLAERGKRLVDLYAGFFGTVEQTSAEIQGYVAQALAGQKRYTRADLTAEMQRILAVSDEAEQIAGSLAAVIEEGRLTKETFLQEASRFHQIDRRLREMEAYWGFVRRMLQRSANYKLALGMNEMYHLVKRVDHAQELEEKAVALVELYRSLAQCLRDAVQRLHELVT